MQILVKRTKIFFKPGAPGEVRLVLHPEPGPQEAPDWIRESALFDLSVKDGSIQEIEIKSSAPSVAQQQPPTSGPQSMLDQNLGLPGTPAPAAIPNQEETPEPVPSVPVPDIGDKSKRK